jgi:hypothetical protein
MNKKQQVSGPKDIAMQGSVADTGNGEKLRGNSDGSTLSMLVAASKDTCNLLPSADSKSMSLGESLTMDAPENTKRNLSSSETAKPTAAPELLQHAKRDSKSRGEMSIALRKHLEWLSKW